MLSRVGLLVVVTFVAVACGPHHTEGANDAGAGNDGHVDGTPQPHTLQALDVEPQNQIVQLDLNTAGTQDFTVTAVYADGVNEDVTSQVTWSVTNPIVGAFSNATLEIPAFAASTAITSPLSATLGTLTGQAQITVVAYRQTGAAQDFFFILPFQDPTGPATKPLAFSTSVPALDVFFLVDTTGSMAGEIGNLQSALTGTVIPGIQAAVANSEFGVGSLQDFPIDPYGVASSANDCGFGLDEPDQPIRVLQNITGTTAQVVTAVSELSTGGSPIGCGNDWPEGGIEAIYQAASGEGLTSPAPTNMPANHVGVGGVGFRQGTMPVVVTVTDATSHAKDEPGQCSSNGQANAYAGEVANVAHTRAQAKAALAGICARVVGIAAIQPGATDDCTPEAYLSDLATTTGARVPPVAWDVGTRPAGCAAGQCCTAADGAGRATDADGLCPVVFDVAPDGTGVGTNIVTGIQMLTRFATFDVTSDRAGVLTDIDGVALPTGHTTADFLTTIVPTGSVVPAPPPVLPTPTFDATAFHTVTPGTVVSFAVNAFNDFVPATDQAQIFRATIRVLAGGCTPLDQRDVLILVPPAPIVVN